MDMQKKASLFIIASLALTGCASSSENEEGTYIIDKNGDYLLQEPVDYLSASNDKRASSLILEAEAGNTCYFLVTSEGCSHCQTFEPTFIASLVKNDYEITIFHKTKNTTTQYSEDLTALQNKYGSDDSKGGVDGATPRLYRISQDGCYRYEMYSNMDNEKIFSSYMNQRVTFSSITRFHSISAFSSKKNSSGLSFIYNPDDSDSLSFYYDHLYPLAKTSKKTLDILDYSSLSNEDKASMDSNYSPLLSYSGSTIDIKSEKASALSLIEEYYK
jgi:hypothetical protein